MIRRKEGMCGRRTRPSVIMRRGHTKDKLIYRMIGVTRLGFIYLQHWWGLQAKNWRDQRNDTIETKGSARGTRR